MQHTHSNHIKLQCNNVYKLKRKQDIPQYLHAYCFIPTKYAWKKAVKAVFFATWPSLTSNFVEKHLPKSPATVKGHMKQAQNMQGAPNNQMNRKNLSMNPSNKS
eukprot:3284497-Ditylum_brightwellii.AAC.1